MAYKFVEGVVSKFEVLQILANAKGVITLKEPDMLHSLLKRLNIKEFGNVEPRAFSEYLNSYREDCAQFDKGSIFR